MKTTDLTQDELALIKLALDLLTVREAINGETQSIIEIDALVQKLGV